jgi:Cu(I)/Ag(I) efflux system protein CusF
MSTGKVTIRHGEIKSIDMPPMTMVFTAKPKSTLDGLKVGDKIDFVATQENDALFITKVVKTSP